MLEGLGVIPRCPRMLCTLAFNSKCACIVPSVEMLVPLLSWNDIWLERLPVTNMRVLIAHLKGKIEREFFFIHSQNIEMHLCILWPDRQL
jgi:hypothetical protein